MIGTAKHFIGDGGTDGRQGPGRQPLVRGRDDQRPRPGLLRRARGGRPDRDGLVQLLDERGARASTRASCTAATRRSTEILKDKMGFDGLVVSDWNGIGQVAGCTNASCPQAINAGIDIVMVPAGLEGVHRQHLAQVAERPDPDGADRRRGHPHPAREAARRAVRPAQAVRSASTPATPDALDAPRARARGGAQVAGAAEEQRTRCCRSSRSAKVLVVGKSADACRTRPAAGR